MKGLTLIISILISSHLLANNGPWTQKAGIPAEGRHRTSGWSIGNKGYLGLGHYNSGPGGNITKADIWEYDPTTDSWTQKADYGGGATYGAVSFTIDNYAYVGAHVYGGTEFYKFDPILNTWTIISPCPGGTSDKTAFAINGKGYFVSTSSLYEYDPVLDTWTLVAFTPVSIYSWSKSFVVGGKAFIICAGSGAMYEYKPSANQFVLRAPYPGDGVGGWVTFETETKGYVATGYIQYLNPTSRQIWEYDPDLNVWNQLEELPGSTRRFASSFSINNKGYLGTGTNGNNFKDFWEFDPALALSYDELSENVEVTVFPNPSTDQITISLTNYNEDVQLELFDMNGRLILNKALINNSAKINIEEAGKGTFIYRLSSNNFAIKTGKVIFE